MQLGSAGSLLLIPRSCLLLTHPNFPTDDTILVHLTLLCPQANLKLCQGVFNFLFLGLSEMVTVVLVKRPVDDLRCMLSWVAVASRQTQALCTTIAEFVVVVINF